MQAMIDTFLTQKQHYFCKPVLESSTLKINSSDLINFLNLADDVIEFDWFRLKVSATKAIAQAGARKRTSDLISHYQRCEEIVRELTRRVV